MLNKLSLSARITAILITEFILLAIFTVLLTSESISIIINNNSLLVNILIVVFLILSTATISYILITPISNAFKKSSLHISLLAKGIIPEEVDNNSISDLGKLNEEISSLSSTLNYYSKVINTIGSGSFIKDLKPLNEHDQLGIALVNMQKNLELAHHREEERGWIVKSIAEIGEILRQHNEVNELGDAVLRFLAHKIHAVQAALYTVSEEDENMYIMTSCFAYNRKKYLSASFKKGHGLPGQTAFEKATILRTEIPDDYFTITSGLIGDQKPKCLLLVPLMNEERAYGVIELAGVRVFKENEIKLIEEVAPIISRTIYNIRINERTKILLEQSQRMGNELKIQQEELRKNAEDMQITQEKLKATNEELELQIDKVNKTQKRMQLLLENASEVIGIYELDGAVRYLSPSVFSILGYDQEELMEREWEKNIHEEDLNTYKTFFNELTSTAHKSLTLQLRYKKSNGEWIWIEATGKNLMTDPAVHGVVINLRDITVKRKAETEERMRKNMQALSENSPDLITRISISGRITYTNPSIQYYTGKTPTDFIEKDLDSITETDSLVNEWRTLLETVKAEKSTITKECQIESPEGKRIMQINAIPEFNESVMESVLVVAHDITERKLIELEIQDKNNKISESITYSKRIQNSIVPNTDLLTKILPDSFIFYLPKDTVSGDFPWYMVKGDNIFVAAVDCTGHGVPGAMLSLVGCFLLNSVVEKNSNKSPGELLDLFDQEVNTTLNINDSTEKIKDGMDIALCKINLKKKELEYAGAHRPLFRVSKNELLEYKGDRWAIGGGTYKNQTNFTNYKLTIDKGDEIYIFSDGLPDQFGGPANKKFSPNKIRETIMNNRGMSMKKIGSIFQSEFDSWKGNSKQMDDVLLIGIKF
ncbi:MAG TPA: PAS domain S-box protein [Cytophagaceae bacterium]